MNSAGTISCTDPKNPQISISDELKEKCGEEESFGIALSHHGPPDEAESEIETLSDWASVSKFMQNCGVRVFMHGHGHRRSVRRCDIVDTETESFSTGKLKKDEEFLQIMAPTTHLNENVRADSAGRGFSIVSLQRSNALVERVVVDTYELLDGTPKRLAEDSFYF